MCTILPNYYIKLSILQIVGPIRTHTRLDILLILGLICNHLISYCMMSAINSKNNFQHYVTKHGPYASSIYALSDPRFS
jgi:hypothetical protein